jgi:hypothetical protein
VRPCLTAGRGGKNGRGEHNNLGDSNPYNEQEGTIGTEDPQCAFGLTPTVKRQRTAAVFDEPKIFVSCRRQQ